MRYVGCHRRSITPTLAAVAMLAFAGCATKPPPIPEPTPPPPVAITPEPPPPVTPAPVPPPKPPPALVRRDITVVFDADTASAALTAAAIAEALPPKEYRVTSVDSANLVSPAPPSQPSLVIAVGRAAVDAARARLPGRPIVFCQVFAYEDVLKDGGAIWGVHSLPPLALQLKTWRTIDPTLRSVAVILGEERGVLAAEAAKAATSVGTEVRLETSHSDRETLYLFKRLATQVDGLWLLPDNRVLSPTVLRELLSYANAHSVGVLALNESLLRWGALVTAASVPADIAETVRFVAERVASGKTLDLPSMTPLRAVEVHVNPAVAAALGLPRVAEQHWVARDPD
jgi:ABC-type uncharacterized transport system substrate-binding protein